MRKIFLLLLLTNSIIFAKSPYSLEQIEEHLNALYKNELKKENPLLKRWVEDEIKYSTMFSMPLKEKGKEWNNQIDKKFEKVAKLTNKKFIRINDGDFRKINIMFIYTNDFFRSFDVTVIQIWAFNSINKDFINKQVKILKKHYENQDYRAYTITKDRLSTNLKKDGLTSFSHSLIEVDQVIDDYFDLFLRRIIILTLIDINVSIGDIRSIFGYKKQSYHKYSKEYLQNNEHWHKIDEYFLEALYSNQVEVGMPLKKAIPIMSRYIYNKMGDNQ